MEHKYKTLWTDTLKRNYQQIMAYTKFQSINQSIFYYLFIFAGWGSTSRVLEDLYGSHSNMKINSSGNTALVQFLSDDKNNDSWFTLQYKAAPILRK